MKKIKIFLLFSILIWLFWIYYIATTNSTSTPNETIKLSDKDNNHLEVAVEYHDRLDFDKKIKRKFESLVEKIKLLEDKNLLNQKLITDLRKATDSIRNRPKNVTAVSYVNTEGPSQFFEDTRRKLFADIKDLSFFMNSMFKKSSAEFKRTPEFSLITDSFKERIDLIQAEIYNISMSNNFGIKRSKVARNLSKKIQEKFKKLQNPANCKTAKKLVCDLNKACGYGCQIHHVMFCFIVSYFSDRTMILNSDGWRYNTQGYKAYFLSVSDTCEDTDGEHLVDWNRAMKSSNLDEEKVVRLPIIDSMSHQPPYLPLSIPKEFETEMRSFHGDPFVWWAGQILTFLTQFNAEFKEVIESKKKQIDFRTGCVGVHVRRTDKVGTEAAFHALDEYMTQVEQYYGTKEMAEGVDLNKKRCVYLASDEISVLKEAKKKYPTYEFIFDMENAKSANLYDRYSPESARGVILDIHFLSLCDYLVCTFSSQVCRLAYEYMQTRYSDASWRFRSLDDVYYYGGQLEHLVVALYDHTPRVGSGEIELKKDDRISLAGNHWNGFSKGRNLRTKKTGLFPSYKVQDTIVSY